MTWMRLFPALFLAACAAFSTAASAAEDAAPADRDRQVVDLMAQWSRNLEVKSRAMAGDVAAASDDVAGLVHLIESNAQRIRKTVARQRADLAEKGVVKIVVTEPARDPSKLTPGEWERAQQARQALAWQQTTAVAGIARAREELAKAAAAASPAVKRVHLKSAQQFLSMAESAKAAMRRTLSAWTGDAGSGTEAAATAPRASLDVSERQLWRDSPTYRFARRLAGFEDGSGIVRLELWDDPSRAFAAAAPAPVPAAWKRSTPTLRNPARQAASPSRDRIFLPDGGQIALAPLYDALRNVDSGSPPGPLFAPCGDGSRICPAPGLLAAIATPENRGRLRDVGGVALDIVFDMLGGAGVPGMAAGMDIRAIRNPVLVSLKTLTGRAAAFADSGEWRDLPDTLRHPGNLERVLGYVLVPERMDVLLVGLPSETDARRIDIDSIVLALRTTWRDGAVMGVSLDPKGPTQFDRHYPRVIGVPLDSLPARIMLEADYRMKSIALGRRKEGSAIALADLVRRHVGADWGRLRVARLWLAPGGIGARNYARSAGGRAALALSEIRVLTEDLLFSRLGAPIGTDRSSPLFRAIAAATDRYVRGLAERRPPPADAAPFALLQGLSDLAVVAKLLRVAGVDYPVLRRLSTLPYRRLTGEEAPPAAYGGIEASVEIDGGVFTLKGGADLSVEIDDGIGAAPADPRFAELEAAARRLAGSGRLATATNFVVNVGDPRRPPDRDGVPGDAAARGDPPSDPVAARERLLREARAAAGARDFERARDLFAEAVRRHPALAAARAGLAAAYLHLDRLDKAMRAARSAMILEPWEARYALLAMDIAWRRDPDAALAMLGPEGGRLLSEHYTSLAADALGASQPADARRFAAWATRLWPDSPGAYYALGLSTPRSRPQERLYNLIRAARNFRFLERQGDPPDGIELAVILADLAAERMQLTVNRVKRAALAAETDAARRYGAFIGTFDELIQAIEESRLAVRLKPGYVHASVVQILARANYALALPADRKRTGIEAALRDLDALIDENPYDLDPLNAKANIQMLADDVAGAAASLERALRISPPSLHPYIRLNRAHVLFRAGRCAEGRKDLGIARRALDAEFRAELELVDRMSSDCR